VPSTLSEWLHEHSLHHCRRVASGVHPDCKVCGAPSSPYDVVDLAKTCHFETYPEGLRGVPVYYWRCGDCGFIFTDFFDAFTSEQWTGVVYDAAYYSRVDPDYAEIRPRGNAAVVDGLLGGGEKELVGLDYGGGNGRTAEILRGLGYRYDTYDPFGVCSLTPGLEGRYEFCSAFEAAEHSPEPHAFLRDILRLCSPGRLAVLIGTHASDSRVSAYDRLRWWYAGPRNGHISLHSRESLRRLGAAYGLEYATVTGNTHLLTRGMPASKARRWLLRGALQQRLRHLFRRRA
jgi:2-polyprenyl-6-hydroxyphenyl methylase/3-demethylubiquinone-9 3-methyltransferase